MKPLSHRCGCEIVNFDRDIQFCALHANAEKLLDALKEAVETYGGLFHTDIMESFQKTIADAEGK